MPIPANFKGAAIPLTQAGLLNVCQRLGVKAPEVWAIVFTETDPPHGGYWQDGRPQILYEQHVFHRLTKGRFDATNPDISNSNPGNYGASGDHQYDRLAEAMRCDVNAALMSASWGMGQTLGENYADVGYASVQDLVTEMTYSEDNQLLALMKEILSSHLDAALQSHDWKAFARGYNGAGYAKNHYDTVLAGFYANFASGALPDVHVRAAQMYLMYLGFAPSTIDGVWGARTRAAMNAFQQHSNFPLTQNLDDATFNALVNAWQPSGAAATSA